MSVAAPREGQCPNCGAAVSFKLGASRATVCEYCKTVVVRAGQNFEAIGTVADCIPTGARINLGTKGSLQQHNFEVVGRIQYEWTAGVWDEWYVSFADGRWGWLAEAQGKYYLTFKVSPRPLPKPEQIDAGQSVFVEGLGRFTISDIKQARIVGIAGELPDPVKLGEAPTTADMESEKGAFATMDFGVDGRDPILFVGRELPFESLHLQTGDGGMVALKRARPTGEKLKCPNCGAAISMRLPEQSVRVTCESCHHLLDAEHGAFRVIEAVQQSKHQPRIAIGTQGKLRGNQYLVVGWMVRSCQVDGIRYPWDEYLLWNDATQSFAWLVEADGHWQLATPLGIGEVHAGDDAEYMGRRHRHFSSVTGVVERVLGEFYWEVQAGQSSRLDDYILPPFGLSCERADREVNWSRLEHLERSEVAAAFNKPGLTLMQQDGVGEIQPWPYEATWTSMSHWMGIGLAILFVLFVFFAIRPTPVFLDTKFNTMELQQMGSDTSPSGEHVHSYISKPFDLPSNTALNVHFTSDAAQSWAYASGAVINEASGEVAPFGLESSYYSGTDDDGSWSEGSRDASETLGAPGAGSTIVRADLQWDPKRLGPPDMELTVSGDSFSGWQFLFAFCALCWPILYLFHRSSFEKSRWENSNLVAPASSSFLSNDD